MISSCFSFAPAALFADLASTSQYSAPDISTPSISPSNDSTNTAAQHSAQGQDIVDIDILADIDFQLFNHEPAHSDRLPHDVYDLPPSTA